MKLTDWAKKQGICYMTAYRWFSAGNIPNARQEPTGTIMVDDVPVQPKTLSDKCVIYCRVSNQSRKKELNYQVERCEQFCQSKGLSVQKVYKEVASGMNDKRRELIRMLDTVPSVIVVENKDRLTRFGFNYLENLLTKLGCQVIVVNAVNEDEEDLMKDLVSIITSFCCRLYGLRRSKNKIKKIKEVLSD